MKQDDSNFIPFSDEKIIKKHIELLKNNKVPKNSKGDNINNLIYQITSDDLLNDFLDALILNDAFQGNLVIDSKFFNDINGFKIYQIIENDCLKTLKVTNRDKPFSDKISCLIGQALYKNKNLVELEIFLKIDEFAHQHLSEFLFNTNSKLKKLSYLEINQKYFQCLTRNLNKKSPLEKLGFFYKPLVIENLLYVNIVEHDVISKLADTIENESNLLQVEVIPLNPDFNQDFNKLLLEDIIRIRESLNFSCNINRKIVEDKIDIEQVYNQENDKMTQILSCIDNIQDSNVKNSIISVRSYLNRTIGELLNNALYELEIQRERNPDKEELFTAKGSIKFIAKFLIEKS